jgi:hypothetical protein
MELINDDHRTVSNLLLPELGSSLRKTGHLYHPLVICPCLSPERVGWYNETSWGEGKRGLVQL